VEVLLKEESSYKRRYAMPCNAETCSEDEDEEGVKEEESPAFNMMVLPSAELGRLWDALTFEAGLKGDLSASSSLAARWTVCRWAPSGWATFKESGMTSETNDMCKFGRGPKPQGDAVCA